MNLDKMEVVIDMNIFGFHLDRDTTSFDVPMWVCQYDIYLHIAPSLYVLAKEVITEYKSDRHLAM